MAARPRPPGSLALGGSGTLRSLVLSPDTSHSGSARVTVTASDGTREARAAFTLTVTPRTDGQTSLMHLADARMMAPQTLRFQIVDAGTGATNYGVEYRPYLSPTNAWSIASNVVVTPLGGGLFQVDPVPPPGDTGFYRAKGFRLLIAGFHSAGFTAEEGAGATGPVVVFNGTYVGTIAYTWSDERGAIRTGQVQVNGTTAVVPIPASFLGLFGLDPHDTRVVDPASGLAEAADGIKESLADLETLRQAIAGRATPLGFESDFLMGIPGPTEDPACLRVRLGRRPPVPDRGRATRHTRIRHA